MTLGERIRALRNQSEMTIDDLSEASGLSPSCILHIEKGYFLNPATYKLQRIADALNVSIESLLKEPNYKNIRLIMKRIKQLDDAGKKKLYQIVSLYLESNGV